MILFRWCEHHVHSINTTVNQSGRPHKTMTLDSWTMQWFPLSQHQSLEDLCIPSQVTLLSEDPWSFLPAPQASGTVTDVRSKLTMVGNWGSVLSSVAPISTMSVLSALLCLVHYRVISKSEVEFRRRGSNRLFGWNHHPTVSFVLQSPNPWSIHSCSWEHPDMLDQCKHLLLSILILMGADYEFQCMWWCYHNITFGMSRGWAATSWWFDNLYREVLP